MSDQEKENYSNKEPSLNMAPNSDGTVTNKLVHFDLMGNNNVVHGRKKLPTTKIVSFIILLVFSIIWISPFIIMFFGAFRSSYDAINYPGELFPPHNGFSDEMFKFLLFGEDFASNPGATHNATQDYDIFTWTLNSCYSAIGGTLLYLVVASLAAYVFTFIKWKGRDVIFLILIGTMVVPGAATSVGNLQTVFNLGLNKSILGLIIPGLGGVYGMYLIKTFFSGIPQDLIESAQMDGCSNLKIFRKIVLPLGKTVLYVQGLFGFMNGWNDLVWPQMLYPGTANTKLWTLQVGMAYIINNSKTADLIGTALAGGVICFLPVFVVYLIAQNKIIEGMASAGIKR